MLGRRERGVGTMGPGPPRKVLGTSAGDGGMRKRSIEPTLWKHALQYIRQFSVTLRTWALVTRNGNQVR